MRLRNKILWVAVPILVTLNQICMRIIAKESSGVAFGVEWFKIVLLNPWVFAVIALEIASFLAWLKILATQNLSVAFPISSVSYILILLAGRLLFHETISPAQLVGSFLIISGCWLIGTAHKAEVIL